MDKESYNKLKEIEDELSFIVLDNGLMFGDELGDIWNQLFTYLEKNRSWWIIHNVSIF